MSAESALYSALTGSAAVMAIVDDGSGASPSEGRIYPDAIPQDVSVPAVAYQRIGTDFDQTMHGAAPSGEVATLEVSCVAATRTAADNLADAVQAAAGGSGFYIIGRSTQEDVTSELWATTILMQKDSTF